VQGLFLPATLASRGVFAGSQPCALSRIVTYPRGKLKL